MTHLYVILYIEHWNMLELTPLNCSAKTMIWTSLTETKSTTNSESKQSFKNLSKLHTYRGSLDEFVNTIMIPYRSQFFPCSQTTKRIRSCHIATALLVHDCDLHTRPRPTILS